MKEIDFIPEWYKSGRRRQVSYRTQYAVLGCVLGVMVVWNIVTAGSISKARAQFTQQSARQAQMQEASREYVEIEQQVAELREKATSILEMDSRIDVAGVLGEVSFLVDRRMVLSKVELTTEPLMTEQKGKGKNGSAVRAASDKNGSGKPMPFGPVRFKVFISGVASDASDVAELVRKFEESVYFCEVTSSWRDKQIAAGTSSAKKDIQATGFEMDCYLANYQQKEASLHGPGPKTTAEE
ncbi:MAG: hypothetical protein ACYTEL_06770 [Planctomycetota bacterium]|jgi:cell division protein FtsB